MGYYVYITDQCWQDARTHSATDDIEKLEEKIEKSQRPHGLDRHPPYLKKQIGRQGRLIIEECQLDGDTVLCFVRFLIQSSAEYSKFRDLYT